MHPRAGFSAAIQLDLDAIAGRALGHEDHLSIVEPADAGASRGEVIDGERGRCDASTSG
jgi:hypothetical protein